jgi:hypothetical protein
MIFLVYLRWLNAARSAVILGFFHTAQLASKRGFPLARFSRAAA